MTDTALASLRLQALRRSHEAAAVEEWQARQIEELEDWIAAWIAPKIGLAGASIDRHAAFTDFGLDSMAAVNLSGLLEQRLSRPVAPSLAWEYPTIAEVAAYLVAVDETAAPIGTPPPGEP